jgi:hypothetical protein
MDIDVLVRRSPFERAVETDAFGIYLLEVLRELLLT